MKRLFLIGILVPLAAASIGCQALSAPSRIEKPARFIASEDIREPLPEQKALEIQYIANEGVLITSRDKRVLIDGLHRKYDDAYAFLPDAEREKIESARPPFDDIDLVLVSHMHGDHFHPESVGRHLKNNTKTQFASSQQVVDEVAGKFAEYASIKSRVTPIVYQLKTRHPMKLAGIDVDILGVGHGSGRHSTIQNLGHVIHIGGKNVLHVGDADISPEIFDTFDLEKQGIDIALLPAWFLTNQSGKDLVEQYIKPKHIIAVHIGPSEGEDITRQVKQRFPNADVFTTMLEKRHL